MQKWEYIVIVGLKAKPAGMFTSHARAYRMTGNGLERMDDFKARPKDVNEVNAVGQFIARLGKEGWEMVGTGVGEVSTQCLYFKRPLP